jgi:hypothetical protein
MNYRAIFYVLFTCALVWYGCNWGALPPVNFVKWVENPKNGLKQSKEVNNVIFEIQYKPLDYIIANENRKPIIEETFYKERIQKLGDLFYLTLTLKSGSQDIMMYNLHDSQEYFKRVNYYSLDFQQDIKAVIGNDTLPCLMYQFENMYGVTPYVKMSIAFSGKHKTDFPKTDPLILIDDRIFGGGLLRFVWKQSDLENIPSIKVN